MNERELTRRLHEAPVPDEPGAADRAWGVARQAFAEREPVSAERRIPVRALLALALVGAIAGIAVSPAGSWIRDRIGRERTELRSAPVQTSLPAPGRLLVSSPSGAWVVRADGARRFLGAYEGASWSPRGLFAVAWRDGELAALEPDRTEAVRWRLTRRRIADARWSAGGNDTRIAYRSGGGLRVVAGDGTGDRLLARAVAPVAPAWRPGDTHVLAFVGNLGEVRVVDVDRDRLLWRRPGPRRPVALAWSSDGSRLLVAGERALRLFAGNGRRRGLPGLDARGTVTAAAARPGGSAFAIARYERGGGKGTVDLIDTDASRTAVLFAGDGPIAGLAWSPTGTYLALGWELADQWVFTRPGGAGLETRARVAEAFERGPTPARGFALIEGWTQDAP